MSKTKDLTNALLKEKMTDAMVDRGYIVNIDNCKSPGIYLLNSTTISATPGPYSNWNYGILEVFVRGTDVIQRITHRYGYAMAVRTWTDGSWRPWYILNMNQVT